MGRVEVYYLSHLHRRHHHHRLAWFDISLCIPFSASIPPCFLTALLAERSLLVAFSSRLEVPYVASWGNA